MSDDGDDFQNPTTYPLLPLSLPPPPPPPSTNLTSSRPRPPLKPSNFQTLFPRPSKKPKSSISSGKENRAVGRMLLRSSERVCSSIPEEQAISLADDDDECPPAKFNDVGLYGEFVGGGRAFQSNFSIESRLMGSRSANESIKYDGRGGGGGGVGDDELEEADDGTQLDDLLHLCFGESQDNVADGIRCLTPEYGSGGGKALLLVQCPLCGVDISDLNEEQRQVHSNDCLDRGDSPNVSPPLTYRMPNSLSMYPKTLYSFCQGSY